jgi:hypothetical protein
MVLTLHLLGLRPCKQLLHRIRALLTVLSAAMEAEDARFGRRLKKTKQLQ